MISREVDRYLPFLATAYILITDVKARMGREETPGLIKKHAVVVALDMRNRYK